MSKITCRFTVFFESPYWVGIYERISSGELTVCKITFGAEPKDYEVYDFLLQNWHKLRFTPPVRANAPQDIKKNPKRMQREAKRQLENTGVGTKAQQAIQLGRAEGKEARRRKSRQERQQEQERLFAIRQEKLKQKHKGH